MAIVYIGLGSNLNEPSAQINRAVDALKKLTSTEVLIVSPVYETEPVGFKDQPRFLNAVAKIETAFSPETLLESLLLIEQQAGRKRISDQKNGPRTLDLDVLLYDQLQLQTELLTIPHPRMLERSFVLVPLKDIEPGLIFPNGQHIDDALQACQK